MSVNSITTQTNTSQATALKTNKTQPATNETAPAKTKPAAQDTVTISDAAKLAAQKAIKI